ncbi:hypothetical protein THRCLA_07606 [Thraustotheca clavata]|uniref:DUF4246 domain-containing protein n=1 Tax=Thraustotheca clavata TaxID=74557 RepID=A0A1V9ZCM2_9STRA|nr:hypothetical protein THRCLA_07606 [Thraustotheca clavata]
MTRYEPPYLRIELDYIGLLNKILDKPSWFEKLNNSEKIMQWQKSFDVPEHLLHLILQELQLYKAHLTNPSNQFAVPNTALGAIHSDFAIHSTVIASLARLAMVLESSEAINTIEQVMDIVDPDMYCVVFGVTKFSQKPYPGVFWPGDIIAQYPTQERQLCNYPSTNSVQWLPTPFYYKNGQAKFISYLNNIPWGMTELYSNLETILSAAMPLIEYSVSLSSFRRVKPEYYGSTPGAMAKMAYRRKHNLSSEDIMDPKIFARWKPTTADLEAISVPTFPMKLSAKSLNLTFECQSFQDTALPLQVVVKMQSYFTIPKTKRKAQFQHPGTEWQNGSGLSNEPIVATAFVVYEMENVAPIRLEIRECFERKYSFIDPATNQEVVKASPYYYI